MDEPKHTLLVSRRRAILGAVSAMSLPLTPVTAKAGWRLMTPECRLASLIASNRASARAIGRAYLEAHTHEANTDSLVKAVLTRLDLSVTVMLTMGQSALKARADGAVRDDFGSEDTVMLEGWVLSRTELRLCALVALGS